MSRKLKHGLSYTYENKMYRMAKWRAKVRGVPFNLEMCDIAIPSVCPLLDIPIVRNREGNKGKRFDSPSLDCFDPIKGYVKGNVWVISNKANSIKREFSLEQWKKFVTKLEERQWNQM